MRTALVLAALLAPPRPAGAFLAFPPPGLLPPPSFGTPAAPAAWGLTSTAVPEPSPPPPAASNGAGGTGMVGSSFNLVKACVGAGILSLPSGVAALSSSTTAIVPAVALLAALGGVSGYSFYLIGKMCRRTGADSLTELWARTVSPRSESLVTLCTFFTPLGAALAYSIILADTFTLLASTFGLSAVTRTMSLLTVTGTTLFPLCMLSNLSALAPVSVVGVGGIVTTAAFMAYRALGSYAPGAALTATLAPALRPAFSAAPAKLLSPSALVLVSMAATAFLSHFNAPSFHKELRDNTDGRFKRLALLGFGGTFALSAAMMAAG